MARTRKDEARALTDDERSLVEKSHQPQVQTLSDTELVELRKLLRERRDRAQRLDRQRRRKLRGKAPPKGTSPASSDAGTRHKLAVLAMAVRRLNSEHSRRRQRNGQVASIAVGLDKAGM